MIIKKKDFLILGKGLTQGLDARTQAAEKMYSINFPERNKTFRLRLHYNGANSYLFVNGIEIIEGYPRYKTIFCYKVAFDV